jgi:hypothetical protein
LHFEKSTTLTMKPILYFLLVVFAIPALAQTEAEQDTRTHAEVELKKGPVLRGWIVFLKQDTIDFKVEHSEELTRIALNDINKITYLDNEELKENEPDPEVKQDNPITEVKKNEASPKAEKTRNWDETFPTINYLFVPSALPLEKGDFFYNNKYILLHSFHVGVTKRFSIYAGGLFRVNRFFSAGVRYNIIQRSGFSFSTGLNYLRFGGDAIQSGNGDNIGSVGLAYLAATRANAHSNFTVGVGYLLLGNGRTLPPSILLGGTTRISNHIALTGESWILFAGYRIPSGKGVSGSTTTFPIIFSYAMRLVYEDSHWDIGFINNQTFSLLTPIGIPYIGYTRRLF